MFDKLSKEIDSKQMKKPIWLFGENLGKTARDNGFLFFKYCLENNTQVDCYFVYDVKNFKDNNKLKSISNDKLIKRNTRRHSQIYLKARFCIVSHGIKDAVPDIFISRKKKNVKPIIYLQHGVIKYKKIFYNSESYNKNILRFVVSSESEKEVVTNRMMPRRTEHQLKFLRWKLYSHDALVSNNSQVELGEYIESTGYREKLSASLKFEEKKIGIAEGRVINSGLPRYDRLRELAGDIKRTKTILIFPTWREWLANKDEKGFVESDFFKSYFSLLSNTKLCDELKSKGWRILFLLHVEKDNFVQLFDDVKSDIVEVITGDVDVQKIICQSTILITDYSSLSWDFNALNKEVVFYQFDYEDYYAKRGSYVDNDSDWIGSVYYDEESLIESIGNKLDNEIESNSLKSQLSLPSSCSAKLLDSISNIKKKIYFFVYNIYGVGGTVRTVTNFANWLYTKGYEVEVVSVRRTSKYPKMGLHPGIRVTHCYDARRNIYKIDSKQGLKKLTYHLVVSGLSRFKSFAFHKDEELYDNLSFLTDVKLLRKIKNLDDCIAIGTLPSINIMLAKWTNSTVKVIAQEHRYFDAHSKSMQDSIKKYYSGCDIVTVLTQDDKSVYEKQVGGKILIAPNGTHCPESPVKLNNEFIEIAHVDNRVFNIVCLGRYVTLKQIDLLILAADILKKQEYNISLNIYGHGELKAELVQQVKQLGLEDCVTINGAIDDVATVYRNSDLCVLTSSSESFGMTIIEANAEAVPIVCFDIDYGPKELVIDGINGLKASCFDYHDLANKISYLIDNPDVYKEMCYRSHEHIKNNYSIDKSSENLRNIIQTLE